MSDTGNSRKPLGLEEAYAVESPEDSRRLYADWATTYDNDFIAAKGYIYHRLVAETFSEALPSPDGAVLDVGCGTGIVGQELRRLGVTVIDGIDISPEMLSQAALLNEPSGAVYRNLLEADLTGPIDIESDLYTGIVSAGTFTHGHLGPDSLSEIFRVAAPGARCAIGINSAHFDDLGFRRQLDHLVDSGAIEPYELVAAPIYQDADQDDPDNVALVVVLTVG